MSGEANNLTQGATQVMRLPIITPFVKLIDSGWKLILELDGEEKNIQQRVDGREENVVLVALNAQQAQTILAGRRSADWICDLQSVMQGMVDDGDLSIQSHWNVTGSVRLTVDVSGYDIEATTEEDAVDIFTDLVSDDWENYSQGTTDFDVEDVEAEPV